MDRRRDARRPDCIPRRHHATEWGRLSLLPPHAHPPAMTGCSDWLLDCFKRHGRMKSTSARRQRRQSADKLGRTHRSRSVTLRRHDNYSVVNITTGRVVVVVCHYHTTQWRRTVCVDLNDLTWHVMANSHLRRPRDSNRLNCWVESRRRRKCKLPITH